MNRVIVKKALVAGAILFLGYHAQRYARLMWALRPAPKSTDEEERDVPEERDEVEGIIRVSLGSDDEDS